MCVLDDWINIVFLKSLYILHCLQNAIRLVIVSSVLYHFSCETRLCVIGIYRGTISCVNTHIDCSMYEHISLSRDVTMCTELYMDLTLTKMSLCVLTLAEMSQCILTLADMWLCVLTLDARM